MGWVFETIGQSRLKAEECCPVRTLTGLKHNWVLMSHYKSVKHAKGLKLGHHIPVPSYYQHNLEKKFLMLAQRVGEAKTEVIKVGGVTLMRL